MVKKIIFALSLLTAGAPYAAAQSQGITINVTSADDGEPVVGAAVLIQDSKVGGVTDVDGKLTISKLPVAAKKLTVSYLGMQTQTVTIKGNIINVVLAPNATDLNEVVVTAMGISRQKKALGYATQEVSSDQLTTGKDNNILNSLSGKLAGVRITNSQGDVGSSRIVIRSETSIAGENQPLFIVDGIPVDNSQLNTKGVGRDFKNAIADLNPEDILSMSVLKGPNAAALYGARAAHGAIIITTKTGKGQKGLGVTGHLSAQVSSATNLPEFQNLFGQGAGGRFSYVDGKGAGINDGVDESWGPRLDVGLNIPQFDSPLDANVFDADYVKLREVSLTYQLPVKFVRKFHLQDASVALTARNLWTIHKDAKDIDPEAAISSGNAQGVEAYTLPTTRQIGINLNVKF